MFAGDEMFSFINLLCGIGLFLLGMTLMSDYTVRAFGDSLKGLINRLTKNKLSGVLTGVAVTGIIQSSCVTTVTALSFVEAGLLSLSGALGIVMGANIGTTVTSLIIAFDFSAFAPVCIFIGAAIKLLFKSEKAQCVGLIISGFGALFVGLNTMASSFSALKESEIFLSFISSCTGKLRCILIGFVMTAVMQSSSATVGILQSLAMQGLIPIGSALYIVLGQNIGAVVPVFISCTGAGKKAKQVAVMHLMFNLLGTLFFLVLSEIVPIDKLLAFCDSDSMKISVFHILFNTVSTVLLLPFSDFLIKISDKALSVKLRKTKKETQCSQS